MGKQVSKSGSIKSDKLRESAKGQQCQVNIFGICNYQPETVVLAHLPSEVGSYKSTDLCATYACDACHSVIDRRIIDVEFEKERDWYLLRGVVRTLTIMHYEGLIEVK